MTIWYADTKRVNVLFRPLKSFKVKNAIEKTTSPLIEVKTK